MRKIVQILNKDFPVLMMYYRFYRKMGYWCHLKHPKTFNEKIQYLKFFQYSNNLLVTQCADKYAVREYLISKGYSDILVPIIGYWDDVSKINFEMLPDKFVLKCNHGSGYNILCPDKKCFNENEAKELLNKWMKEDFSIRFAEFQYRDIKKKIIAEKYLGRGILDYKFFCFNGIPQYMYISQEIPNTNGKVKCCFWDCNGKLAGFGRTDEFFYGKEESPQLPSKFEKMKLIAKELSVDFPFVRVDLFEINGRIFFSELTFTPSAGMMPLKPKEWDFILGNLLKVE